MAQLATCLLCKSEELSSEVTYHMTGKSDKTQLQPKHSKAQRQRQVDHWVLWPSGLPSWCVLSPVRDLVSRDKMNPWCQPLACIYMHMHVCSFSRNTYTHMNYKHPQITSITLPLSTIATLSFTDFLTKFFISTLRFNLWCYIAFNHYISLFFLVYKRSFAWLDTLVSHSVNSFSVDCVMFSIGEHDYHGNDVLSMSQWWYLTPVCPFTSDVLTLVT